MLPEGRGMQLELYLGQKGWEFGLGCTVALAERVEQIGVDFDMEGMLDRGR